MKFIFHHTKTHTALSRWKDNSYSLLMLDFFFWHQGTMLQKSLNGLLRALLHRALASFPDLIPAVFPRQYQNWKGRNIEDEPSYTELKRAFDLLIVKSAKFLKICAFIDGLDEFESDQESDRRDVAEWLCSLTRQRDHVKIVVSSRPLNVCLNTFRDCPTLKLQDLTRKDMESFIQGHLSSHHIMAALARRFSLQASKLISEIRDKADGVFLWVRLVIQLLVDGLEDGDDFADLEKKLRSLPPDIKDLYQRMFEKMKAEHRAQAAKIFLLVHTWKATSSNPFTINALFFALEDHSSVWALQNEPTDPPGLELFYERTEALLRSRFCGLLEVHKKPGDLGESSKYSDDSDDPSKLVRDSRVSSQNSNNVFVVEYLHRTVAEFLIEQEVWDELRNSTQSEGFDPYINLMSSTLSMVKTGGHCLSAANNISALMRKATHLDPKLMNRYLVAFDEAVDRYRSKISGSKDTETYSDMQLHWSAKLYTISDKMIVLRGFDNEGKFASIFTFAAHKGLVHFLEAFYTLPPVEGRSLKDMAPIFYALASWLVPKSEPIQVQISLKDRMNTLLFLLRTYRPSNDAARSNLFIQLVHEQVRDHIARDIEKRSSDQGLLSYALFVAIFLITSELPYHYIQHFKSTSLRHDQYPGSLLVDETTEHDTPHNLSFFAELAFVLQRSDDLSIKEIGSQVEHIVRKADRLEREACSPKRRYTRIRYCYGMIQDKKMITYQNIQTLDYMLQHNDAFPEELRQEKATLMKLKLGLLGKLKPADMLTFNCPRTPSMFTSDKASTDISLTINPIDRLIELEADLGEARPTYSLSKYAWQNDSAVGPLLFKRYRELEQEKRMLLEIRDTLSAKKKLMSSLDG